MESIPTSRALKVLGENPGVSRAASNRLQAVNRETVAPTDTASNQDTVPCDTAPCMTFDGLPERIGGYAIERQLGVGGMGVVYLAGRPERTRPVAIKVLRGHCSERRLEDFERERVILAGLEHPGIAAIYDGGHTEDGRPWFAMEYIAGNKDGAAASTLIRYCVQHSLKLAERLRLFLQVCDAVEYAHTQGVIHRDLKPENILVDHRTRVRLVDFGIARLMDWRSGNGATPPNTVGRWMTPAYAAPEQVLRKSVTQSCDVYSLGVILYQLLTGRQPLKITERDLASVRRAISNHVPTPPSDCLSASRNLYSEDIQRLHELLQSGLDDIALKALEKDPAQRYASAGRLAEDIRAFLHGLPREVREKGLSKRTQVWSRLNAFVTAVGLSVTLMLPLSFSATRLWQALQPADSNQIAATSNGLSDRANAERPPVISLT